MEPKNCPHCQAALVTKDGFNRVLGCEIRGVYDGVLFWHCPDCGKNFHRFPVGDSLWCLAESFIQE